MEELDSVHYVKSCDQCNKIISTCNFLITNPILPHCLQDSELVGIPPLFRYRSCVLQKMGIGKCYFL